MKSCVQEDNKKAVKNVKEGSNWEDSQGWWSQSKKAVNSMREGRKLGEKKKSSRKALNHANNAWTEPEQYACPIDLDPVLTSSGEKVVVCSKSHTQISKGH